MIYSIACHCLPANDTRLVVLSDALYREAAVHIQCITRDQGIEALQAILLLALRSQFDANTGSLGQLVAFAHRLEIQLNSPETQERTATLQWLRCTVYCLSQQLSSALDRPYNLTEPDATALQETTPQARYLCSLYARQSKCRTDSCSPVADTCEIPEPAPIIFTTMCQTRFMAQASVASAMQVLATYNDDRMVLNVFSSHWVYEAASYVIQHANEVTMIEASIIASQVLERCASKWPSAGALQKRLQTLAMRNRRATDSFRASELFMLS
ncbi:hypothetical protein FE257_003720 [Aspergillus nanangensis]|uniref:Uncharacterized protein n=1 Tax=Aspergillus nanangensis TaxID=2582783 RepID=A0AAD4CTX3_ASPNN|nr:hypothetical protein FE257_003720 [Aspergillus nanangensis]